MLITETMDDDVVLLRLAGRLVEGDGVGQLKRKVDDLTAAGHTKIVLSMGSVTGVDPSGVDEIARCARRTANFDGRITTANIMRAVQFLLDAEPDIQRVLTHFPTEAAAVASFVQ